MLKRSPLATADLVQVNSVLPDRVGGGFACTESTGAKCETVT